MNRKNIPTALLALVFVPIFIVYFFITSVRDLFYRTLGKNLLQQSRRILRNEVESSLIKILRKEGFKEIQSLESNFNHERIHLHRLRHGGGYDAISLIFGHLRPYLAFEFAKIPKEGFINGYNMHIKAHLIDVELWGCSDMGRSDRKYFTLVPEIDYFGKDWLYNKEVFAIPIFRSKSNLVNLANLQVKKILKLMPQVNDFFKNNSIGPNIKNLAWKDKNT